MDGDAGHHRLHDDRLDRATRAVGEPAPDKNPRQHGPSPREDAWHDPLTRDHPGSPLRLRCSDSGTLLKPRTLYTRLGVPQSRTVVLL
jgi:hypothetical protein